jgi:Fe-S oxidoreductase
MCRHVAPVGHVTSRETVTPHGVAQLVASVRRDIIDWDEDMVEALYAFSDNGNSRAHCVTSQPLGAAVAAARAEVVAEGRAPEVVYRLADQLEQWQNPYEEQSPEPIEDEGETALFVGDTALYRRPSVLDAVLRLLEAIDVDPVSVGLGRNSGFLPGSLGLMDQAEVIADANIDEIRSVGANQLLVLSPGHQFALTQMYRERLGRDWANDVSVTNVLSVLAEAMDRGEISFQQGGNDAPYAYVDPTHAVRVKGSYDAPRRLAEAVLPGDRKELFWREGRAHPCGNLALAYTHPDLAERLTRERLRDAKECGARQIVTEDPGSLYHLDKYAGEFGIEVRGLYEVLADRIG